MILYLRSRQVPAACAAAAGLAAVMWTLWLTLSRETTADLFLVVLTVLLMVALLTVTLAGPDGDLDRTAALRWPPRRAAHLLAALALITGILAATRLTGAAFAPTAVVLRDAAGLLGLTALGAATIGVAKSWFAPLGWTLAAILFRQENDTVGEILTWQSQQAGSRPAALTALALALTGLVAYAIAGPATRTT
ncbi:MULTISPECIES: hypothetical protein [Actinoplanes]|uniref:hypothetical protein n=1 Tax=Actinoplanes TaxID=1865 RepID=UPI0005F2B87C|nr:MULTISPECIES: hypothetical protein [Actinoplanes]GLX99958.1 hypothetical protein Acsp01_03380 [Actinoplanes sp. NBRC 101535]